MNYQTLNRFVSNGESRFGRLLWAGIVSLLLMVTAAIYVRPAIKCVGLGVSYARLALDPFNFSANNALIYRILTPLISYLIGLRGELIIITNLIFALLVLITVYLYFRKHAPEPGDALVAVFIICFSLVTLTTIYYGGYTDSATYFIILLMWILRRSRPIFYLLFLLGLFNRESIIFLVPWFAFIGIQESKHRTGRMFDLAIGFGVTIGVYFLFRNWVSSQQTVAYDLNYYLQPLLKNPFAIFAKSYSYQGLGLFTVFKLFWIFPVIAAYSMWKNGRHSEVYSMAILLCCTLAQLVIAFDSSRMLTLGFMIMIITMKYLFETNAFSFRKWVGWALLGNLLVPQLYTARNIIEVMRSLPGEFIYIYLMNSLN